MRHQALWHPLEFGVRKSSCSLKKNKKKTPTQSTFIELFIWFFGSLLLFYSSLLFVVQSLVDNQRHICIFSSFFYYWGPFVRNLFTAMICLNQFQLRIKKKKKIKMHSFWVKSNDITTPARYAMPSPELFCLPHLHPLVL